MRTATIVTVTQLAKKAKVAPKVARSRLRANYRNIPRSVSKGRWAWKLSDAARVMKYISD